MPDATYRPALRSFESFHDDDCPALWWKQPVCEPPYVGGPGDSEWPWDDSDEADLVWVPCPNPATDRLAEGGSDGR